MKCIICQNEFVATTKKQRFCSNSCRQKNYRKEIKDMLAEIREKKAKIKPILPVLNEKRIVEPKIEIKAENKPQNDKPEPPVGLTGIDLAI